MRGALPGGGAPRRMRNRTPSRYSRSTIDISKSFKPRGDGVGAPLGGGMSTPAMGADRQGRKLSSTEEAAAAAVATCDAAAADVEAPAPGTRWLGGGGDSVGALVATL